MRGTTDIRFILTLMVFFGFLTFMFTFTDIPWYLKFTTPFDFAWWVGGIITVTGACVVWTGIPCAAAIAVWSLGTVFQYIFVTFDWLKILIFLPLTTAMVYIVMRLARG